MRKQSMAVAATLALMALAACGKSTTSNTAPSASATGSTSSSVVAQAQAFVEKYSKAPTSIGISEPLPSAPPAGKTFVNLVCSAGTCPYIDEQTKKAAEAIGWKFVSTPFDISNPAALVGAMQTALQVKPVAVSFAGLPQAVWGSVVPAYKKAGAAIIPNSAGELKIDDTVIYGTNDLAFQELNGELLGNWFLAESKADGSGVLVVDFPDVPTIHAAAGAIGKTIKAGCPACKVTPLEINIAAVQSGGASAAIVSALQRDPSIKYLVNAELNFSSDLPSRLKAAGLHDITMAGLAPDALVMSGLVAGDYAAVIPTPLSAMAYYTIDAAARFALGVPVPQDSVLPTQILTKQTLGTLTDKSAFLEQPSDYAEQFKKLWKVS